MKKNAMVFSVLFAFLVAIPVVAQESGAGSSAEKGVTQNQTQAGPGWNCRGTGYGERAKRRADCFADRRRSKDAGNKQRFERMGPGPGFDCPQDRHRHRVACVGEGRGNHGPDCFANRPPCNR